MAQAQTSRFGALHAFCFSIQLILVSWGSLANVTCPSFMRVASINLEQTKLSRSLWQKITCALLRPESKIYGATIAAKLILTPFSVRKNSRETTLRLRTIQLSMHVAFSIWSTRVRAEGRMGSLHCLQPLQECHLGLRQRLTVTRSVAIVGVASERRALIFW